MDKHIEAIIIKNLRDQDTSNMNDHIDKIINCLPCITESANILAYKKIGDKDIIDCLSNVLNTLLSVFERDRLNGTNDLSQALNSSINIFKKHCKIK